MIQRNLYMGSSFLHSLLITSRRGPNQVITAATAGIPTSDATVVPVRAFEVHSSGMTENMESTAGIGGEWYLARGSSTKDTMK